MTLKKIVLILFISLCFIACNDSNAVDKANPDNYSENKKNPDNTFKKYKPEIGSLSRYAFTSTDYTNKEVEKINVYSKINGNNTKFTIEKNSDLWVNFTGNRDWYQIIVDDDLWGYCKRSDIKLYPRAKVNINSGTLNIRENKGLKSKRIGKLEKNSIVYVLNIDDKNWYEIKSEKNEIGYVAGKYLKFIDKKTNILPGIEADSFNKKYFSLENEEYLLLMESYKDIAQNRNFVMGDFNGGGYLDKAYLCMKRGSEDRLFLVVWVSESNTYFIADYFEIPIYIGLELYKKTETLKSPYEESSISMKGDGISLIDYEKGNINIYYWNNNDYAKYVYQK